MFLLGLVRFGFSEFGLIELLLPGEFQILYVFQAKKNWIN